MCYVVEATAVSAVALVNPFVVFFWALMVSGG
jgi:hypothetical protein